ncbi:hypothetical protein OR573_07120 [Halomonas sp. CH40]
MIQRVRQVLKRGSGHHIQQVIKDLTPILRGWKNYIGFVNVEHPLETLD